MTDETEAGELHICPGPGCHNLTRQPYYCNECTDLLRSVRDGETKEKTERNAVEDECETRWQDALSALYRKHLPPGMGDVDGSGSDAGALEFTVSELAQVLNGWADTHAALVEDLERVWLALGLDKATGDGPFPGILSVTGEGTPEQDTTRTATILVGEIVALQGLLEVAREENTSALGHLHRVILAAGRAGARPGDDVAEFMDALGTEVQRLRGCVTVGGSLDETPSQGVKLVQTSLMARTGGDGGTFRLDVDHEAARFSPSPSPSPCSPSPFRCPGCSKRSECPGCHKAEGKRCSSPSPSPSPSCDASPSPSPSSPSPSPSPPSPSPSPCAKCGAFLEHLEWCDLSGEVSPSPSPSPSLPVVYIAGPYRGPNAWAIECNVRRAEAQGLRAAEATGAAVIIPHSMTRFFQGTITDAYWLAATLELLRRADCVLLVPGWQGSEGTKGEIEEADRLGIKVFDNLSDLAEWVASRRKGGAA